MYGCSSEYDPTLEELLEVDLRSEMDRIIAAANGHPFEFMTELEYSSCHEEGMDEIEIRFDASKFDPFSLSSFGLSPMSVKKTNNGVIVPVSKNGNVRTTNITTSNNRNSTSQAQAVPVLKRTSGNSVSTRNVPSIINNNIANQSSNHNQKPPAVVASVGSLGMSGLATLEETLGTLVS